MQERLECRSRLPVTSCRAVVRGRLVVRASYHREQVACVRIDGDERRLQTSNAQTPQPSADGNFGSVLNLRYKRGVNLPVRWIVVSDDVSELLTEKLLRVTVTAGRR